MADWFSGISSQMREILTPTISVVGRKADGTRIKASLSSNDEMFVVGEFSPISTNSPVSPSEGKPFALPGTRIAIMPVGWIIYSVYMFTGISIVMYGE